MTGLKWRFYQKRLSKILSYTVHFSYVAPNYEYEVMSNLQSRWLERNIEMGDDRDATKVYGPDIVEYKKCKEAFEKA